MMHEWETVDDGRGSVHTTTYRMAVPGGWLYKYMARIVFVPEPQSSNKPFPLPPVNEDW